MKKSLNHALIKHDMLVFIYMNLQRMAHSNNQENSDSLETDKPFKRGNCRLDFNETAHEGGVESST